MSLPLTPPNGGNRRRGNFRQYANLALVFSMMVLLMAAALILTIPESTSNFIESIHRRLGHLRGDDHRHLRNESLQRTGGVDWAPSHTTSTNLNSSSYNGQIPGRHVYHMNGTISVVTKDHRYHHIAHRRELQSSFTDVKGELKDDSMGIMYDTSNKSPRSSTTPSGTPIPASSTSSTSDSGSTSTAIPKDPQLVIAGKMVVEDGACNIAQLNLKSGKWSLQQRIQLSLYNSYSGGEVYSMLANHTIVTNSNAKEFSKSEEPSSKGVDRPHVTDNAFGVDLIVVGAFDTTYRNSQTTYCSVGKWDGSQLSKVGEGLCNSALSKGMKITSSAIAGPNDIYVGGSFQTQVWNGEKHEFVKIFNIAHYNSINQVWLPLPVGQITCSWCTVTILALAWDSERRQLHVAGKFNAIDGYNIPAGLAVYDQDSGHLVAHPGGGLAMRNVTQDGVGTAIQFDQENGVLYVMGAFERLTATYEECLGLAAYEIKSGSWTCLADPAHSVLPTGGGNMLLTPYGLLVAGRTANHTTWPDRSRPYTIAVLKATIKKKVFFEETGNSAQAFDDSKPDDQLDGVKVSADEGSQKRRLNGTDLGTNETNFNETDFDETKRKEQRKDPEHEFIWSWLPGFDGHDEPIHTLSNGYGDYVGTVFIGGDNFVSKWSYKSVEVPCDDSDAKRTTSKFRTSCTQKTFKPVTVDLSNDRVHGAVMAISQLDPVIEKEKEEETSVPNNVIGYTILVYSVTLGAVIGMFLALLCNKSINQTIMSFIFDRDAHMKGISLDTLTYSTVKNTNVAEAYHRAMSNRFVKHPHLLTLIDPQEIILHRIIGEGTFGRVWSAKWGSSSVAVKEFVFAQAAVAGKSSQQRAIVEEIIGEAGMMAILRHPNVLQLFGCSLTAQAIWIVSELCSLGSLRQVLDGTERVLTLDVRLNLALQVAEGMAYLHTQDPPIIHRDLKSHNIFVHETFIEVDQSKDKSNDSKLLLPWTSIAKKKSDSENMSKNSGSSSRSKKSTSASRENGSNSGSDSASGGSTPTKQVKSKSTMSAKIGDWGSARATLAGSRTMTHGVGTACWMAPEVLKHARSSKYSDVYGFGIVLWELATRSQVYEGLESTQIIAMVANDNLRPEVPDGCPWNDLMVKCWNEAPQDRPSFEDIVRELNRLRPVVRNSKYTGESLKVPKWKANSYQRGGSKSGSQPKVTVPRQTG
mmetsp:Transcript_29732/g.46000  ORF Transcript_29732/g.46000 Transcript_29732/m.46000 type:complete len:1196 (-) Transcript_29732:1779-5366(-)